MQVLVTQKLIQSAKVTYHSINLLFKDVFFVQYPQSPDSVGFVFFLFSCELFDVYTMRRAMACGRWWRMGRKRESSTDTTPSWSKEWPIAF